MLTPAGLGEADDDRVLVTEHVRRHPGPRRHRRADLVQPWRTGGRPAETAGDHSGPLGLRRRQDGGERSGDKQGRPVVSLPAAFEDRLLERGHILTGERCLQPGGPNAARSWLAHASAATGSSAPSTSRAPPSMMLSSGESSSVGSLTGRRWLGRVPFGAVRPPRRFPAAIPDSSADPGWPWRQGGPVAGRDVLERPSAPLTTRVAAPPGSGMNWTTGSSPRSGCPPAVTTGSDWTMSSPSPPSGRSAGRDAARSVTRWPTPACPTDASGCDGSWSTRASSSRSRSWTCSSPSPRTPCTRSCGPTTCWTSRRG